jgi:hypothetical protein
VMNLDRMDTGRDSDLLKGPVLGFALNFAGKLVPVLVLHFTLLHEGRLSFCVNELANHKCYNQ